MSIQNYLRNNKASDWQSEAVRSPTATPCAAVITFGEVAMVTELVLN